MSQPVAGMSTAGVAAYQGSETFGNGHFTVSKEVEVMSSGGATDRLDLSPDASRALRSFLSGGSTGTAGMASGPGSGGQPSGDAVEISVTAASFATTGRQPDHATGSGYGISWTVADGQAGGLDVEEAWSFTTDLQLVPLSPRLQAGGADGAPGIAVRAVGVTIGDGAGGLPAPAPAIGSHAGVRDSDDGRTALMMPEASLDSLSYFQDV